MAVDPEQIGDYYLGPSILVGDRAALTLGLVFGGIAAPPAGLEVGDTLTNANALANLGKRRALRPFFGLSFSFLGNGPAEIEKPILGAGGAVPPP